MQINIVQLDLNKTRENWPTGVPFAPAYVKKFKRNESANWLVLEQQLVLDQPPTWAKTANDEYMRIPLFPYSLNAQADLALAFMLQLGLSCAGYLPAAVGQFFVVTGTPVELLYNPDTDVNTGIRYFVGFAVILK